jgi:PAS domain S-box-containing protein
MSSYQKKPKSKILLVDYDSDAAQKEIGLLRKHGFAVIPAATEKEALKIVNGDSPIDLILIDIDLEKKLSGRDMVRTLSSPGRLPVVFLTSRPEPEVIDELRGIENFGCIPKSTGGSLTISTITMALALSKANKKAQESEERWRVALEGAPEDISAHKEMERLLQASQERFNTLVLNVPGLVYECEIDRPWCMNYMSDGVKGITGRPASEFINTTGYGFADIIVPEDLPEVEETVSQCVKAHVPYDMEYRVAHVDGTTRWVHEKGQAVYGEDGTPLRLYGVIIDITDHKRVEDALAHEVVRRRLLVEQSQDGIVILQENGKVYEANQKYAEMLGYTREEVQELYVWDWDHQISRDQLREMILKVDVAGDHFETRHWRKDGTIIDVEISSNGAIIDNQKLIFCVCRDISDRKEAEEALRVNEELYRTLVSASPDAITMTDLQGLITYASPRALEMFGFTSGDEVLNHSIMEWVALEDRDQVLMNIEQLMRNGRLAEKEYVLLRKDGSSLTSEIGAAMLRNKDGSPRGMLLISRDVSDRKRAEEQLLITNAAMKSAISAVGLTDLSGRIIFVNDAYLKLWGYDDISEVLGKYAGDFIVSQEQIGEVMDHLRQGKSYSGEGLSIRKDGSVFDTQIAVNMVIASNGRPSCIMASFMDITERKAMERNLRESESRFKGLFYDSPVGLEEVDTSGTIEYAESVKSSGITNIQEYVDNNPEIAREGLLRMKFLTINKAALKLYEAEDIDDFIRGSQYWLTHGPAELFKKEFLDIAAKQPSIERERKLLTASHDNEIWVHSTWTVVPGEEETYRRLVFCDVDITERKKTEATLIQSEERYRNIFNRAVEGIFQSTLDGHYITVNPAFAHMLGYDSPEELMSMVTDIANQIYLHPEERKQRVNGIARSIGLQGIETQYRKKDGTPMWVFVNARPVKDKNGAIVGAEGTMVDITERKEAEAEREKLQTQLRQAQKMEAIGTLAGGVAHDFNNILSILTGYGTLLQMKIGKDDPLRMYTEQILSACQKAASLTHSLLAFSRQQPITLNPLNINDIVRNTEKLLRRLLTEDITLKTVLNAGEHSVLADPTQIDQILFNLTTNARDAMPTGGTLIIETDLVDLDATFRRIHGFGESGRYLRLSITDTGHGMDEATREKIFEPFFTTKDVGRGTGLGLATVYGIVKQHNGYVNVYSEINSGTSFHIYLPSHKSITVQDEQEAGEAKRGSETILFAEDNDALRTLVVDVLTQYGYTVIGAEDGQVAIDNFLAHPEICLVILDSVMPKKNGRAAYDTMRQTRPDLKAIFVSGYTRDIVLDKGIEEGEVDFLSKPLQMKKLIDKIREVLDR